MKTFKTLLIALVMVAFVACSDSKGSGYSPETCAKLADLIEEGEELDEEEYSQMISQYEALSNYFFNKIEEYNYDRDKFQDFLSSREGRKIDRYGSLFDDYLSSHASDLTRSQRKQLKDFEKRAKKRSKEIEKRINSKSNYDYDDYDYDSYDDYGYEDY